MELALLTDLYQLTMAQAAWQQQRHELRAVFHLSMRRCPFGGDFAIVGGVDSALDYAATLRFEGEDLTYLAGLPSRNGGALFDPAFLEFLSTFESRCDVWAVEEGETLLAGSPIVRVEGGLLEAQLLETPLLNLVGVQTLVATRAARICHWAAGELLGDGVAQPVLEFGLRRAHGPDGALSVSRAAFLGGCAATSNLLAGKAFGIPVKGTHAHSWVLSFDQEIESFRAYAKSFPDDTTLLVDTYSTERGVERAAEVGEELARAGHELVGIRLDSGDLADLSIAAREILDRHGLRNAAIAASGDLDEGRIEELRRRGARIDVWGVGARLATSRGDASFSGAYKLSEIEDPDTGAMRPVAKISEDTFKRSLPGRLQVRRVTRAGRIVRDLLYDERFGVTRAEEQSGEELGEGADRRQAVQPGGHLEETDLLSRALVGGQWVREAPSLDAAGLRLARERAASCVRKLGWRDRLVGGATVEIEGQSGLGDAGLGGLENGKLGPPPHGLVLETDAAVEVAFAELLAKRGG